MLDYTHAIVRAPAPLVVDGLRADGGDALVLPHRVIIGPSSRTDRGCALELIGLPAQLGKKGEIAKIDAGLSCMSLRWRGP